MSYNATEEESSMIQHGKVTKSSSEAYICCIIDSIHYYLTINGEIKTGPKLKNREAYHDNSSITEIFLAKWIKGKEVIEIEEKPVDELIIKRMSHIKFKLTIKEILNKTISP